MKSHTFIKIDVELLDRLRQGDEGAFEQVYRKYGPWVYNFVYSLLYDKLLAEDLTQTVFLKIWEKRKTIDPELGLDAYLFAIARNLVYKETENKLQMGCQLDARNCIVEDVDSHIEEKIDAESLRSYIRHLIEQLPPVRKQIFCLSRYEHLQNKEIATRLSISEKTVENQITRALRFLRDKLSEDTHFLLLFLLLVK